MSETSIIIGNVRFSYANVFTPRAIEAGSEPKFSVSLIIPKSDTTTIKKIERAIKAALEAGKASKFGGKIPANYKNPLRDGDKERPDSEEYADSMFINASSNRKPGLVDRDREEIIASDEFYSGCYGRADINFYAFAVSGSKGIAAGLNNLQKIADGEALGGTARSAAEAFGDDDELM